MKKFRKLIPALALLLVSAVLMSTASYAWFSMNNQVKATGMEVKTKVSNNLFIKKSTLDAHTADVNQFLKADTITLDGSPLVLQPVSTVNGVDFYYTDPTENVGVTGRVIDSTAYIAYTDSSAFNANYATTDSVPYVDFIYELVAFNTDTANTDTIKLTDVLLTYTDLDPVGSDATGTENAFRVAVFVEKYNSGYNGTTDTLKGIFGESTATYFEAGKAVVSSSALDSVQKYNQVVSDSVAIGSDPQFYQVIVRLWLEGEDTTCRNDTYADLSSGKWKLDLTFAIGESAVATTVMSDAYYTPAP